MAATSGQPQVQRYSAYGSSSGKYLLHGLGNLWRSVHNAMYFSTNMRCGRGGGQGTGEMERGNGAKMAKDSEQGKDRWTGLCSAAGAGMWGDKAAGVNLGPALAGP